MPKVEITLSSIKDRIPKVLKHPNNGKNLSIVGDKVVYTETGEVVNKPVLFHYDASKDLRAQLASKLIDWLNLQQKGITESQLRGLDNLLYHISQGIY